jgi:hypothetical protein
MFHPASEVPLKSKDATTGSSLLLMAEIDMKQILYCRWTNHHASGAFLRCGSDDPSSMQRRWDTGEAIISRREMGGRPRPAELVKCIDCMMLNQSSYERLRQQIVAYHHIHVARR